MKLRIIFLLSLFLFFSRGYSQGFSNTHIGGHIGFSVEGHLPIGVSLQTNKLLYGFSFSPTIVKGVKGENYTGTVNWDEYPEDHVKEGSYTQALTLDLGYFITERFAVGIGLGYGWTTYYRNCFDDLHILGNNGTYYIEAKGEGSVDGKAFVMYKFPISDYSSLYLQAGYDKYTSAFICIGIQI